jgi:predicted RNA-binding Zn ribbon-like protein
VSRRTADADTPRSVALVQDFLNSLDLERFGVHAAKSDEERDDIRTPELLTGWLRAHDLLPQGRVTSRDVAMAASLRAGLRALLRARQGLGFDAGDIERGNAVAEGLHLSVQLDESMPRLEAVEGGVNGALARLLAELATAQASRSLDRLKVCSADDCQFVFYDHSKSRTQRWCAMETCGNRVKTKRYRARHHHG